MYESSLPVMNGRLNGIFTIGIPAQANMVFEAVVVIIICLLQSAEFRHRISMVYHPCESAAVRAAAGPGADGAIFALTQRRVLGVGFNPVSFYFCHRADGTPHAVVAEVTSTLWGETERYMLSVRGHGPVAGLVLADGADPRLRAEALQGAAEGKDLAVVAALVRPVDVQRPAVLRLVIDHGHLRVDVFDRDAVAVLDPLPQLQRLRELVAGLQVEDRDRRLDPGEHVDDAAALRPERRGHDQPRVEVPHRPAEDVLRGGGRKLSVGGRDLLVGHAGSVGRQGTHRREGLPCRGRTGGHNGTIFIGILRIGAIVERPIVGRAADGKVGALVELNSETDFVAKNDDFIAFAASLAELVATRNPANVDELASLDTTAGKVEAKRQALVQKIGENISIRRFKRLQAKGKLALYVHGSKIGVLVDYEGPEEMGKDLAMHVDESL